MGRHKLHRPDHARVRDPHRLAGLRRAQVVQGEAGDVGDDGLVAVANPPEEFGAFVRSEIAEWSKLIREMKL